MPSVSYVDLMHASCSGGSSGASMHAAVELARTMSKGQRVVALLPDSVRNYMTKFLSDKWLADRDIIQLEQEKLW